MIVKMFEVLTIISNNKFISIMFFIAPMPKADNGCDTKLFDTAMSVQWANEDTAHGGSNKKKRRIGGLSGKGDDSDEDINLVPPPFDIYRSRQQKRVSK